jgi:hypothetical protein
MLMMMIWLRPTMLHTFLGATCHVALRYHISFSLFKNVYFAVTKYLPIPQQLLYSDISNHKFCVLLLK